PVPHLLCYCGEKTQLSPRFCQAVRSSNGAPGAAPLRPSKRTRTRVGEDEPGSTVTVVFTSAAGSALAAGGAWRLFHGNSWRSCVGSVSRRIREVSPLSQARP